MKPQSKIPHQKSKPLRLLVVEDSPRDAEIAIREIQNGGFDVTWKRVETGETMGTALGEETWDIILCDYNMPQLNGLAAIALLKKTGLDIPLIIFSGAIGEETAVACMRHGAQDYVMKGNLSRLVPAIERELQEAESRRKRREAESQRKAVLDDLKASEAKYRLLADHVGDVIFVLDMNFNYTYISPSVKFLRGYEPEDVLKQTPADILTPSSMDLAMKTLSEIMEREKIDHQAIGKSRTLELEMKRKDGTSVLTEVKFSFIRDENQQPLSIVGVTRDITERKQQEETLLSYRQQMRSLSSRLQVAWEEERTRIARKIHDEIGGLLTGLKIDLSLLLRTSLKTEDQTIKKSLLDGIDGMIKSIDVSVPEIRRLAMELRPGVLDELGFVAAMEWHLHDFQKRTGINCKWIPSVECINIGIDLSTALFRIFQEALTNVVRHSGATEVRACLRADEEAFVLEVEDNGKGFEKEKLLNSDALGFLGMKERAQIFGGSVTISGKPGMGTKVTVNIPSMKKRKTDQEGDAR